MKISSAIAQLQKILDQNGPDLDIFDENHCLIISFGLTQGTDVIKSKEYDYDMPDKFVIVKADS